MILRVVLRVSCITLFEIIVYTVTVMWTPSSVQHFKRLERLHSKFHCISSRTDPTVCVTLTECRRFHTAIQIYKILHHLSPPYLHNTFHYTIDITGRASGNIHRLFVLRARTTLAKHSFYFRGSQLWNSLNPLLYVTRKLELLYKTLAM